MNSKLVLSVGMPRAGSGWHYNLVHDLVVAAGGSDARQVRKRYFLGRILTEVNCNIGTLSAKRLIPCLIPVYLGKTYTIKAHAGPKPLALKQIDSGRVKTTYIYRDPRDALLSAYEYGKRIQENKGRPNAFSHLTTIDEAIDFIVDYVEISRQWLNLDEVFSVRYEDLLTNYDREVYRLCGFLDVDPKRPEFTQIIESFRPGKGSKEQRGTHFVKGKIGRYREKFTDEQKNRCRTLFGDYLETMGYPTDE